MKSPRSRPKQYRRQMTPLDRCLVRRAYVEGRSIGYLVKAMHRDHATIRRCLKGVLRPWRKTRSIPPITVATQVVLNVLKSLGTSISTSGTPSSTSGDIKKKGTP